MIEIKIRTPSQDEIAQLIEDTLPKSREKDSSGNALVNIEKAHAALSQEYSNYIVDYVFDEIHDVEPQSRIDAAKKG